MYRSPIKRSVKTAVYSVIVVLTCIAGVAVGHIIRGEPSASPADQEEKVLPDSGLKLDIPFPEVALANASGDPVFTSELISDHGAVVLFVDPACEPCTQSVRRWQDAIDAGELDDAMVVGIFSRRPERIEEYTKLHNLSFPVLFDASGTFRDVYKIKWMPFEVIVGASGIIRATGYDYQLPVDTDVTLRLLVM